MVRTNFIIKLVSAILAGALAIYFSVYLYNAYVKPYGTIDAAVYTVELSNPAEGVVVREELLAATSYSFVSVVAEEGRRVSAGQTVALAYDSQEDMELEAVISRLELEISELEAGVESGDFLNDVGAAESAIQDIIVDINTAMGAGDVGYASELGLALKALVFSAENTTQENLEVLREELAVLGGGSATQGIAAVTAEAAGVFSDRIDGFEYLSPADMWEMSPADILSASAREAYDEEETIGKLVTDTTWYFAAVLPKAKAAQLQESIDGADSSRVQVLFTELGENPVPMTVEQIGHEEDGECAVILSADSLLSDTLGIRRTEVEIIYGSYSGIRVPREAVYTDQEGNAYVYTETGLQAEQKYVSVVYEYSNYYLIEAAENNAAALKAGNSIIVGGEDMYDGKVIG